MVGTRIQAYVVVPQHGPLSLHTKSIDCKLGFPFPMVRPWDDSQGPLDFQSHGSWSMCKAALSCGMLFFT